MIATAAAVCALIGHAPFVRPDSACTPGAYKGATAKVACATQRGDLSAADRRWVLSRYGFDPKKWTGKTGELDHRVPVALGGVTTVLNVWPEPEPVFNTKDRLEAYVIRRVCRLHTMRLRTGRMIFRGDWTAAYRKYFKDPVAHG